MFLKFSDLEIIKNFHWWGFIAVSYKNILSACKLYIGWAILRHIRRVVARSENPGGLVVLGGDVSPLVEIGLTYLPKTGGAKAPPSPPDYDSPVGGLQLHFSYVILSQTELCVDQEGTL